MTVSTDSGSNSPVVICAENAAFLSLLHKVPILPSTHPVTDLSLGAGQGTRILPIDRESRLAGAVALLTSLSNDSNCITAASIVENQKDDRLDVLVAVNRAKERDQGPYLDKVATGLRTVFEVLARASHKDEPHVKAEVFTAVVTVSYARIVGRLRFIKPNQGRRKGKIRTPLRDSLQQASNAVQSMRQQLQVAGLGETAEAFLAASKPMLAALLSFENHQTIDELESVIGEALRWSQSGDIARLFNAIPNRIMSPETLPALLRNLKKVAQYRIVSRDLYRSARRFPILRRAKVIPIDLGAEAFVRQTPGHYQPELDRTLKRISPENSQKSAFVQLSKFVKKSENELREEFKSKVRRILKESKIHAEVQILAYLEDRRPRLPPRVVRSSKKACFLCNSLFALHKTYSIPQSHGRLYEGWRLPCMPCLQGLHQRLNHSLELQARKSVGFLLQQRRPTGYPDPYESSALNLPCSTTTVNTNTTKGVSVDQPVEPGVDMGLKQASEANPEVEEEETDRSSKVEAEADTEKESPDSLSEVELSSTPSEPPEVRGPSLSLKDDNSLSAVSSTNSNLENLPWREVSLVQGRTYAHKLNSGSQSCLYTLGKFELCLEHFNERASSSFPPKRLKYEIKWLYSDEAQSLREHRPVTLVDPRALSPGEDVDASEQNPIYFVSGEEIIQLTLH
ncbi:hypothetical protein SODALDRAFT_192627 [Sodiomyces alkalinus F11]|uniref:Uncharacterized protein n=1 Tax=Sodiomyces alkalinus (strain CBS 110278 / VKM F-3762 / F11) TaxID=1314773 RepID=A0A3N2PS42_SODAK|nr:hypothetical protein SODALDRAFT_192627 [Sodiomyces alkalinus F11]ROT37244.1 hypothetical protein SODALDRAFT_192627 [Sodiomyces alkalinus F11]